MPSPRHRTQPLAIALAIVLVLPFVAGRWAEVPEAEARRKQTRNMPKNWTWPPNAKMRVAGKDCLTALKALDVDFKKISRPKKVATPVVVPSMTVRGLKLGSIFRKGPFVMDCHLVRALASVAPQVLELGIKELRFSTIHQYRRVRLRGRTLRALSRHSLGLAVDVYQLVTSDGRTVVVEDGYEDSPEAQKLEALMIESGLFRAVLTPGNDPRSHYDHFHLEARMVIAGSRGRRQLSTEDYARVKKEAYERKRREAFSTPAKRRAIRVARERSKRQAALQAKRQAARQARAANRRARRRAKKRAKRRRR